MPHGERAIPPRVPCIGAFTVHIGDTGSLETDVAENTKKKNQTSEIRSTLNQNRVTRKAATGAHSAIARRGSRCTFPSDAESVRARRVKDLLRFRSGAAASSGGRRVRQRHVTRCRVERSRRANCSLRDDVRLVRQARLVDRFGRLDRFVQRRSLQVAEREKGRRQTARQRQSATESLASRPRFAAVEGYSRLRAAGPCRCVTRNAGAAS